jgi:opacity protein-like surface antigen
MKKLLFLLLGLALASWAYSFEIKFMGGIAFSKPFQVMQIPIPEYSFGAASGTGFLAGAGVEFSLIKNVSLEIDGLYFQKRYKIGYYELGQFRYDINGELNELSFPLLLKISILRGTTPYFLGGGEFAFVLSHKWGKRSITQDTRKTDTGPIVGAGFEMKVRRFRLFLEGRYHIGVRDLSRGEHNYFFFKKLRSLVLLAGFSF